MKLPQSVFDTPLYKAATALPPVAVPKVKKQQQSYPGYATGTAKTDSVYRREDLALANTDITSFRFENDSRKILAKLIRANPDLAGAANAYVRVGLTRRYKCYAENMDGTINREATIYAQQLTRRFDLVPDYMVDGFSQTASLRSVAESLGLEILVNGAMCSELVLDKAVLPSKIVGIPVLDMKFYPDGKGSRPVQVVGGEEIDLDFPTIIYTAVDQSLKSAYANSPFESAIQPVLADSEYFNDLRRLLKRAMQPRLQAIIESEKVLPMIPPEAQADPVARQAFYDQLTAQIQATLNNMAPEDALVAFDFVEFSFVSGGTGDVPDVITVIQELLNAKMSTGSKTLPSVLGHGSGSQNIASSETLLFMKGADGIIRAKLNEHFSKTLTLAVRLTGQDVAVTFEFDEIELRPESELEAFRTMRQSRVLEQLSYGFIEDDRASISLTGYVTPAGFTPLSGTQFYQAKPGGTGDNPYSGSNDGSKSGGGALNQSQKSNAPKKGGGRSQ